MENGADNVFRFDGVPSLSPAISPPSTDGGCRSSSVSPPFPKPKRSLPASMSSRIRDGGGVGGGYFWNSSSLREGYSVELLPFIRSTSVSPSSFAVGRVRQSLAVSTPASPHRNTALTTGSIRRQRHSVTPNSSPLRVTAMVTSAAIAAREEGTNAVECAEFADLIHNVASRISRQSVGSPMRSTQQRFATSDDVFKAWESVLQFDENTEKLFRRSFTPAAPRPIKKFSSVELTEDQKRSMALHKLSDAQHVLVTVHGRKNNNYDNRKSNAGYNNNNNRSASNRFSSFSVHNPTFGTSASKSLTMLASDVIDSQPLPRKKRSTCESPQPHNHYNAGTSGDDGFSLNTKAYTRGYRNRSCDRSSVSPSRYDSSSQIEGSENFSAARRASGTFRNRKKSSQACGGGSSAQQLENLSSNVKIVRLEDDYNVYKQLGTGRFGYVRLAEHKQSGMRIAMKFFPRPQIKQADFLREYNFSRFLSPHPNIIDTFEGMFHSNEDCAFFFVQEFCPHASLREAVESSNGGIGEATTKLIMLKVLSAIEFMHGEGLVHRNIKAENILIFDNVNFTRVKVTDFGLTRKMDTTVKHLEYVNTYHAPELCETVVKEVLTITRSIDIWALGITFFYALRGRFPWQKATIMCKPYWEWDQWLKHKLPQLPKPYETFTEKALKLFKRCLNPRPKDRWTVKELKRFVEKERLIKVKSTSDDYYYYDNDEKPFDSATPVKHKKSSSAIHKLINTTLSTMAEISEQVVSARDE